MATDNGVMRGDLSEALARARTAFQAARAEESQFAAAVFHYDVGRCLGALGRPREALAAVDLGLRAAENSGPTSFKNLYRRALFLCDQGRLEDARAEARTAAASAEAAGFLATMTECLAVLAETSIRQDDLAKGRSAHSAPTPRPCWQRAVFRVALGARHFIWPHRAGPRRR